jgi:peptidoglycan/LPS O-acetylase OafA/YrhL
MSRPTFLANEPVKMTPGELLRGMLRLLWHALRLPVLMFLVILEPVVRFVLGALALLGVLVALFFKAYGVPHFPFVLMLGVSVGLGLMLAGYQALLDLLGRERQ